MTTLSAAQFPPHPIPASRSTPRDVVKIVFTDFPNAGNECVFVEVEDAEGNSISAGYWKRRADGLVEMVISRSDRVQSALLLGTLSSIALCLGAWMMTAAIFIRYF
jgi:hypothetical protein